MSLYVDLKYLKLISNRLPLFKQKSDRIYNCRCVICGDSSRKKNKARGYFYVIKNDLLYKCHNCGIGLQFGSFLKEQDRLLYDQYVLERYTEGLPAKKPHQKAEPLFKMAQPLFEKTEQTLLDKLLSRLDTLDENNEAVLFCLKRKIPKSKFNSLYFIDDIKNIEQLSDKYKDKIKTNEPRLVIPFFNKNNELLGVTCRALRNESLRYLTIRLNETENFVFGLDKLNTNKQIFVVEGPLDSLFLENAIAVGGTAFNKLDSLGLDKEKITVILDNQPRNKEVVKLIEKIIMSGFRIVIWPHTVQEKDINDMILSGKNIDKLIKENTYKDLEANLKFIAWKRI